MEGYNPSLAFSAHHERKPTYNRSRTPKKAGQFGLSPHATKTDHLPVPVGRSPKRNQASPGTYPATTGYNNN
jgi:hypothetical protein